MSFFSELKRRNVWRMAAVYAVIAWLIMQVTEVVVGLASLPDWLGKAVLAILAIGFPIALVFAWVYELTPEGLRLEKDVDRSESITAATGRRMDFIVIAVLAAALIVFALDKWWLGADKDRFDPPPNSIAVMAFANMSGDPDKEYFSDGISEELLNLLAKVPELRVISRTSAFSYKGKSIRLSDIARDLNVANILEGSIRLAADNVRITAQLIDTASDTHIWSEAYDRDLGNVLAVQDEIAAAVLQQLKVSILGEPPSAPRTDPQAYALFLQARHHWRQGSEEGVDKAHSMLQQVLEIDPGYARAWTALGTVYTYQVGLGQLEFQDGYLRARQAAQRALEIDPDFAEALSDLGWYAMSLDNDFSAAASYFRAARQSEPRNSLALGNSATFAAVIGRLDDAAELMGLAIEVDPVDSAKYTNLGAFHLAADRLEEADTALAKAIELSPGDVWTQQAIVLLRILQNRPAEALRLADRSDNRHFQLVSRAMALHDLGRPEDARAALDQARDALGEGVSHFEIAEVYAHLGRADEAFEALEQAFRDGEDVSLIRLSAFLNRLSADPRWTDILARIGLADEQVSAIEL